MSFSLLMLLLRSGEVISDLLLMCATPCLTWTLTPFKYAPPPPPSSDGEWLQLSSSCPYRWRDWQLPRRPVDGDHLTCKAARDGLPCFRHPDELQPSVSGFLISPGVCFRSVVTSCEGNIVILIIVFVHLIQASCEGVNESLQSKGRLPPAK